MPPPNTPTKPEPKTVVLSQKAAFTLPVVLIVVGIVTSNLTMMFGMQGKTDVLEVKMKTISEDVKEVRTLLTKMHAELTDLRVEVATLKAQKK